MKSFLLWSLSFKLKKWAQKRPKILSQFFRPTSTYENNPFEKGH